MLDLSWGGLVKELFAPHMLDELRALSIDSGGGRLLYSSDPVDSAPMLFHFPPRDSGATATADAAERAADRSESDDALDVQLRMRTALTREVVQRLRAVGGQGAAVMARARQTEEMFPAASREVHQIKLRQRDRFGGMSMEQTLRMLG